MFNDTTPFVINAAINFPFCVLAIVGNLLILVSFARTPSLVSPSNVLLIGLALTDLCVGLIVQPAYIAWKIHQHFQQDPTLVGFLGGATRFASSLLCGVSYIIVSSLSVDRFLAVHLHLRYHEIVTVRRVAFFCAFVWFPCSAASSLGAWKYGYFELFSAPFVGICLLLNAVLYSKIYRVVRRHQLQVWNQVTVFQSTAQIKISTGLKNSFINIFYLYIICLICYVPYMTTAFISILHFQQRGDMHTPVSVTLAFEVSWTITFINSSFNPLLFSWRLKNIRAAVKRTLKDLLC